MFKKRRIEQCYLEFGEPDIRNHSLPSPGISELARKVLELRGWEKVRIVRQGWDDHPLGGRAWSIVLEGYPPTVQGGNAELFDPGASAECIAGLHERCVDTNCLCASCYGNVGHGRSVR